MPLFLYDLPLPTINREEPLFFVLLSLDFLGSMVVFCLRLHFLRCCGTRKRERNGASSFGGRAGWGFSFFIEPFGSILYFVFMGRPKGFSREQVLDKAVQVFWKKGFADTSLHDLEKATGVNKSGLYAEFTDKDEIFIESLKRYAQTADFLTILEQKPLGLKNLETFLLAGSECSGQKGCFFANSIREVSVIPVRAKPLIEKEISKIQDAIVENLKALKLKKNTESAAKVIFTFRSGICLSLNLGSDESLKDQVSEFLKMLCS